MCNGGRFLIHEILGQFWATYSKMPQKVMQQKVPVSYRKTNKTQYFKMKKYDTFRKDSLS